MRMAEDNKSCLIKLDDNALLIANTGQPFSRLGVVSICASHLGTKQKEYKLVDPNQNGSDAELIQVIKEQEIEVYKNNPNRIITDSRAEEETSKDYQGRYIWELLQNADDAMAPADSPMLQYIGIKGLGFKSVLEITEEPEIHSGPFHFSFSSKKIRDLFIKEGISDDPPPLTFRIPFKKKPDDVINDLLKEHVTVIKLPFKSERRDKIHDVISALDPSVLLFCQYIERLIIFIDSDNKCSWSVKRDKPGTLEDTEMHFKIDSNGQENIKELTFRRWGTTWSEKSDAKRHNVSFCLPLDNLGNPTFYDETPPLHVFFPTVEEMPFHVLAHASFELEQNRKHIRDNDINILLIDKMVDLFERMLNGGLSPITTLKSFVPVKDVDENSVAGKFWLKVKQKLKEAPFVLTIGSLNVIPDEAKSWSYNIGNLINDEEPVVIQENLVIPELLNDEQCKEALKKLGMVPLDKIKYPYILRYCKNKTKEQCIAVLDCLYQLTKIIRLCGKDLENFTEYIKEIPCWWNQDAHPRSVNGERPLFKKPPAEKLPSWLQIDYLENDFYSDIKKYFEDQDEDKNNWIRILKGSLLESKKEDFLYRCLLPSIKMKLDKEWWEIHGREVLKLLKSWIMVSDKSFWSDENRIELAYHMKIPTGKGWLPAIQCYAGKKWGGFPDFDKFFKKIPDRGIIIEPAQWPVPLKKERDAEIDTWREVLSSIGVSWNMKLIRFKFDEESGKPIRCDSDGWHPEFYFSQEVDPELWIQYWKQLKPDTYYKHSAFSLEAKIQEQWVIEYFPEALPQKTIDLLGCIQSIAKEVMDSSMKYYYFKDGYRKTPGSLETYAKWQLEDIQWIPCKQILFKKTCIASPKEVYLPGKGLTGIFPEIDITMPEGQKGRDISTFLTQDLGVHEDLPSEDDQVWVELLDKLPDSINFISNDGLKKILRGFFKAFFSLSSCPSNLPSDLRIPFISKAKKIEVGSTDSYEKIEFQSPDSVYWLDEHFLAEPKTRNELLKHYSIFLMELNEGKIGAEWFEIIKLSSVVNIIPNSDSIEEDVAKSVIERYEDRQKALELINEKKGLFDLNKIELKIVKNLKLSIKKEDIEIASPNVSSWAEKESIYIDSDNKWRGFANVYSQITDSNKNLVDTFENILKAASWEEVKERLRERGIPDEALKDLVPIGKDIVVEDIDENGNIIDNGQSDDKVPQGDRGRQSKTVDTGSTKVDVRETSRDGSRNANGQVPSRGIREKIGKKAEDWFRAELDKSLEKSNWDIVKGSGGGSEPYDIEISDDSKEIYIEVKSDSKEIFFSENEVNFAKKNKKRYIMVLVGNENDDGNRIISLIFNPLKQCRSWISGGVWKWRKEWRETEIPDTWVSPKPPVELITKSTLSFSYILKRQKDGSIPTGFDELFKFFDK